MRKVMTDELMIELTGHMGRNLITWMHHLITVAQTLTANGIAST